MTAEQEALFTSHTYLARRAARYWASHLPGGRGLYDDFHAAALAELWRAAVRYDPAGGRPFRAYANVCTNMAVRDWFRSKTTYFGGWRKRRPPARISGAFAPGGALDEAHGGGQCCLLAVADPPPPWEAAELVDRLLAAVPEPHRTRAGRYFLGGEDSPAIARSEGVAKTNVCRSLRLALGRMREESRRAGLLS